MSEPEPIVERVEALEADVARLQEATQDLPRLRREVGRIPGPVEIQAVADECTARSGWWRAHDQDIAELQTKTYHTTQLLNILRQTQVEQGNTLREHGQILGALLDEQHSQGLVLLEHTRRFESIDRRLDAIDSRFESIDNRFEGIDQRLESMDNRFEGIDQRLESMDNRFESIDNRFESIDGQLDGIGRRLDTMDSRLDRQTQVLTDIALMVRELTGRV